MVNAEEGNMCPTLSVLLPIKNTDLMWFHEALASIISQDADFWFEVVIIDSSPEPIRSEVATLSSESIRYFHKPFLAGLVEQLNFGLEKCRGRYVARMDGDDVALPSRLWHQVHLLESDNDLSVVGAFVELVDESGKLIGQRIYPIEHAEIVSCLPSRNPICHPTTVFRKSEILSVGGYSKGADGAEDYDLWVKLFKAGCRFYNSPRVLLSYRMHNESIKYRMVRKTLLVGLRIKLKHRLLFSSCKAFFRFVLECVACFLPQKLVYYFFYCSLNRNKVGSRYNVYAD